MRKLIKLIKKSGLVVAAILLTGIIIVSCKKDVSNSTAVKTSLNLKSSCAESIFTLWAGQSINAGNLVVWNDYDNLYIEYQITNPDPGLALTAIHLWAGKDLGLCPTNKNGNPKPGQFPYYADAASSVPAGLPFLVNPLDYTVTIPLTELGATCYDVIYIAAHGAAATETMWSEGINFVPPPGDWASYSTYTICCGVEK